MAGVLRRLMWLAVLLPALPVHAVDTPDLQAAIVFQVLPFVDWPSDVAPAAGAALTLCVDPASRLAAPLRSLQGRLVRQASLTVLDLPAPEALRRCHAVWLDDSLRGPQAAVRRALRGLPVLVIGDEPSGAVDDTVDVHLVPQDGRVGFEVDVGSLRESRLQISSRLLRLARRVRE